MFRGAVFLLCGSSPKRRGVRSIHGLLIVTALWAATYLPGLGAIELKGEEGRRVLPAVTMLETGEWIVPFIGGEPYLRKPPLIHWLIAASFRLTGHRDEWAARIPSALSVLALSVTIVVLGKEWLGLVNALIAAICAITNLGMLEKGRLCELEALYISMTGIALMIWVTWWRASRSPWLIWTVPFVFLGFGLLTKGPLHLLFFYAVVAAILWQSNRVREMWSRPHLLGVIGMLGMFALWGVPYFQKVAQLDATAVWTREFTGRITHSDMSLPLWLENLWNNFANFLPWLVFTPLWWNRRVLAGLAEADVAIFRGMRLAVVFCGCGLVLIPGVLSRYTLPLIVPASLLTALAMRDPALLPPSILSGWRVAVFILFGVTAGCALAMRSAMISAHSIGTLGVSLVTATMAFRLRRHLTSPAPLAVGTACAIALGVSIFVAARVPRINAAERTRPIGRQLNALLPQGSELYVINAGFSPALFYVRAKCTYVDVPDELPLDARYVLMRASDERRFVRLRRVSHVLTTFEDAGDKQFRLLVLEPPIRGGSRSADESSTPQ